MPKTILFVEDDEAFRYTASHHLKAEGYSVVDVPSSTEALRLLDQGGVDAVIIDVALYPNEPHGVALGRMIRMKDPKARILFVTGITDIQKLEPGMPGDVLFKPIELADLSRKVEELLA